MPLDLLTALGSTPCDLQTGLRRVSTIQPAALIWRHAVDSGVCTREAATILDSLTLLHRHGAVTGLYTCNKPLFDYHALGDAQPQVPNATPGRGAWALLEALLENAWPFGLISLAEWTGISQIPRFVCRVLEENSPILPHIDILSHDWPFTRPCPKLACQLAVNLYLKMPARGGETLVYGGAGNGVQDYPRSPASEAQALLITSQPGDIGILHSTSLHGVSAGGPGPRITMSCFLGQLSDAGPLLVWG
jgi:hypothetical protein